MPNVVITNGGPSITAAFNGLNGEISISSRNSSTVATVELKGLDSRKGEYVEVVFDDGTTWTFDNEGDRGMVVDTVAGVAVSRTTGANADIVAKVAALMTN